MYPNIKKKWLEALRSGQFTQGRGMLKTVIEGTPRHCCLGVLCEVMGTLSPSPTRPGVYESGPLTTGVITPAQQIEWGLPYETMNQLVYMNDGEGASFAEIADHIEANL